MNGQDAAGLITAVGTVITALGVILVGWWTYHAKVQASRTETKAKEAKDAAEASLAKLVATEAGIYELGKRIDGRMDELLVSARESGHTAGMAEQKANRE